MFCVYIYVYLLCGVRCPPVGAWLDYTCPRYKDYHHLNWDTHHSSVVDSHKIPIGCQHWCGRGLNREYSKSRKPSKHADFSKHAVPSPTWEPRPSWTLLWKRQLAHRIIISYSHPSSLILTPVSRDFTISPQRQLCLLVNSGSLNTPEGKIK